MERRQQLGVEKELLQLPLPDLCGLAEVVRWLQRLQLRLQHDENDVRGVDCGEQEGLRFVGNLKGENNHSKIT